MREYYYKNIEKCRAYGRNYYYRHKDQVKEYRLKNIEKIKEYNKQYSLKNKEKKKEYRLKNRERFRQWQSPLSVDALPGIWRRAMWSSLPQEQATLS